jgi:Zn-dependent peptidase ImmA (M78 family)/transcriptional regulator with XRE-family HTH domain
MIVIARQSRGLGQRELAELLQVTPSALSRLESGLREVSPPMLQRLVTVLEYPEDFFRQNDMVFGFGISEMFHRKRQSVGSRTLDRIHAQINIRRWHVARLLRSLEPVEVRIRTVDLDEFTGDVEDVAREMRAAWRLPRGPVQDVTRVIENAGGIIIPFNFGTRLIDAISEWPPDMPPLFFVNTDLPGDRLRFTLCHELGHLILHSEWPNPDMEKQASRFAAEFLMPERDIRRYLDGLSLPKLAALKEHWKVAMSALLKRASDLGCITPRHARTLWMQMGQAGYQKNEPVEIPREEGNLFVDMIDVHRKTYGYSVPEFAQLLNSSEGDIREVYFNRQPLRLLTS